MKQYNVRRDWRSGGCNIEASDLEREPRKAAAGAMAAPQERWRRGERASAGVARSRERCVGSVSLWCANEPRSSRDDGCSGVLVGLLSLIYKTRRAIERGGAASTIAAPPRPPESLPSNVRCPASSATPGLMKVQYDHLDAAIP